MYRSDSCVLKDLTTTDKEMSGTTEGNGEKIDGMLRDGPSE